MQASSQFIRKISEAHGAPRFALTRAYAPAMRFSLWPAVIFLVVLFALAGCGGGGGGSTDVSGQSVSDPETQLPASQYSAEQRNTATGRIAEKYEQLIADNVANRWEALKEYVLTQPEFVEAGIGEEVLWAKFTDGRYFLYVDNWKDVPAAPLETEITKQRAVARKPAIATKTGAERELPRTATALMLKSRGSDFVRPQADNILIYTASALEDQGWNVPQGTLTVDALKGRGELGILYLNSHSGALGNAGDKRFAVFTDTPSFQENEEKYAADIADGSLIYTRHRSLWQAWGIRYPAHYAFTSTFVKKYLNFSPNSLVILMMCNAGSEEGTEFRAALTAKQAGTIIAWKGPANAHGYRPLQVMFDRLTSANFIDARDPPNRAFHFDDVWDYLERRGLLINPPSDDAIVPSFIKRFGDGFDLTNPVITELQVAGINKMFIRGEFGSEPGSVTIGGTTVPSTWVEDGKVIGVDLPTGAGDPPGSHGDVVVTARGRKSNARTLTSWRGQITYLYEELPGDGAGILSNTVTVDLHLRADPYAIRADVDGALKNNTWNIIPATDTKATWSAGGTRSFSGKFFEGWSGNGSLAFAWPAFPPNESKFNIHARIDAVEKRLQISPFFTQTPLVDITRASSGTTREALRVPMNALGFYNPSAPFYTDHQPLAYGTTIPLDAHMDVPASEIVVDAGPQKRMTVRWTRMTATPAISSQIGR